MSEPSITQEGDRSGVEIPSEREKGIACLVAARARLNAVDLYGRHTDIDTLIGLANETHRSIGAALWHLWKVKDE